MELDLCTGALSWCNRFANSNLIQVKEDLKATAYFLDNWGSPIHECDCQVFTYLGDIICAHIYVVFTLLQKKLSVPQVLF